MTMSSIKKALTLCFYKRQWRTYSVDIGKVSPVLHPNNGVVMPQMESAYATYDFMLQDEMNVWA